MTGELADCYASRDEGVREIVAATVDAVDRSCKVRVYTTAGTFVKPSEACDQPDSVAAANWHALASYATRYLLAGESGVLIDVGSTTSVSQPTLAPI